MNPLALEAESISTLASSPLCKPSFKVHVSAEIATAQRCLFYALTLPEYLEAWLHMPDTTTVHATLSDCPDELRLDRYRFLRHVGSILVRFHATSEDSIRLAWCNFMDVNTSSTSVHVTLRGKRRHCMLDLTHTGFRSEEERRWYHAMWTRSLADLSRLMSR
jgi:hypothetical protein